MARHICARWIATVSLSAAWVVGATAAPIPTVLLAAGQKTPTHAEPVRFCVTFSEAVFGFAAEDVVVSLGTVAALLEIAPNNGTTFEVEVRSVPCDGAVGVTVPAGAGVGSDGAPNVASPDGPTVTMDRTPPPPPEIAGPLNATATAAKAPKLSWSVPDDASGIKNYRIVLEGPTSRDTYTTRTSYSPTLDEGAYSWRLNCRDQVGNASLWTETRTFVVDRTPPGAVSLVSPSHELGRWMQDGEIRVEASGGGDTLSGTGGYEVAWSQEDAWAPSGKSNRDPTWAGEAFSPLEDGSWWCHVASIDRAGNRGEAGVAGPFCIDRTPPELAGLGTEIRRPNDPGQLGAAADWSTVTAVDLIDPSPSIRFSVPSGLFLPLGRSAVTVTAEDAAGNVLLRTVPVLVYNTEPPAVHIAWPTARGILRMGETRIPEWSASSLAEIERTKTEGLVGGCLDTRTPGRHTFSVTVVDSTGLTGTTSAEYLVLYGDRHLDALRVRPDGTEEPLSASTDALGGEVLRSSEWLRVRCRVDAIPESFACPPITYSLVRTNPLDPKMPIVEKVGVLIADGATHTMDLPLIVFPPGEYTLWIGFVDETNVSVAFRLVR
jgi:hypothetical protein